MVVFLPLKIKYVNIIIPIYTGRSRRSPLCTNLTKSRQNFILILIFSKTSDKALSIQWKLILANITNRIVVLNQRLIFTFRFIMTILRLQITSLNKNNCER